MEKRLGWDEYFLNIAKAVAERSSCLRNKVGAVIVNNKDIISTGYNGAPQFQNNCIELGFCYRNKNDIPSGTQLERCRAVGSHAESNAISLAARNGNSTSNATIYIVGHNKICNQCKALIANANIKRVVQLKTDGAIMTYVPEIDWKVHPIDEE
jgi:dCMP deaminase